MIGKAVRQGRVRAMGDSMPALIASGCGAVRDWIAGREPGADEVEI